MTGTAFVDADILVYNRDASEPGKQQQASHWITHLWRTRGGRLSMQVLQEYYVTVTQKLRPGIPREAARNDVQDLLIWRPVVIDGKLLQHAWTVQDRFRLAFWDALIVAAAQTAGCRYLVSEGFQPDQPFDGLTVVNPFLTSPASLP